MFALKLNNSVLDVAPDARISVVLSCPIFDPDRIVRSFSYPFGLPLTPHNRAALRHIDRFDAANAWETQGCQLWIGGGQYETGELASLGSSQEEIEAMFRNVPLTVLDDLKRIYINEILDTITIAETGGGKQAYLLVSNPPVAYEITFGGNNYLLDYDTSGTMTKQEIAEYFRDLINADFPGTATATIDSLVLDTDKVNEFGANWDDLVGLTFTSYNPPGTVYMRSMQNYVEGLVATPADEVCFPIVKWEGFYENKNPSTRSLVNPVFDAVSWNNIYTDDEKSWYYSFVPAIKIPYILEKIREQAGIGYLAGWLVEDADATTLAWLSERSLDKSYRDFTEDNLYEYINGFEQAIVLNKHVPKLSAFDFLARLARGLNLVIEYRDGGLHFTRCIDLVADEPADWNDYMDISKYNRTLKKPEGSRLYYSEQENEAYDDGGQLDAYEVGLGGRQVEMPFRTMAMGIYNGLVESVPGDVRMPHTNRPGKCPAYGQDTAALPMHLLFVRGLKDSSGGDEYLYASHDELDVDGTTVIGGLSLAFEGDYGLVPVMFGNMLEYGDFSDLDISAVLPESALYDLRRWRNARVRFYHPNGSVVLVLKSVEFEVSVRGDEGFVRGRVRGVVEG